MGRPAVELMVAAEDRMQLESIARSQSLPAALSRRAQMILRLLDGETNSAVARRYRVARPTVSLWRKRFAEHGIAGLHNELKPGRPRSTGEDEIATLINTALTRKRAARHTGRVAAWWTRLDCRRVRTLLLDAGRIAAAPLEELQAVERPVLHRGGARHRRVVSEPARPCTGA
jgi:transposase